MTQIRLSGQIPRKTQTTKTNSRVNRKSAQNCNKYKKKKKNQIGKHKASNKEKAQGPDASLVDSTRYLKKN